VPSSGAYDVVVWNGGGYVLSDPAQLTVNIPARVLTQPQSQTVTPGATVTFSVVAEGTGVLRYRWQFNGNDIPNATNASLVVANAQLANEGNYRVLITDDIITVPSAVARLTVKVRATVLVPPAGSTNVEGSSITFSVVASGSVPMGFLWRKGANPFGDWVVSEATNSAISLSNLRTNDSGDYRVIITNSSGIATISTIATLLVVAPPAITSQPASRTVFEGTNVSLTIGLGGTAPFVYQWHRNGSPITGATNASLAFTNVQLGSDGTYYVVATNLAGTVTSDPAVLTIIAVPRLINPSLDINGNITFTVHGNSNRTYAIEISSNLIEWVTMTNVAFTSTEMPIADRANRTNRFYRARLVP